MTLTILIAVFLVLGIGLAWIYDSQLSASAQVNRYNKSLAESLLAAERAGEAEYKLESKVSTLPARMNLLEDRVTALEQVARRHARAIWPAGSIPGLLPLPTDSTHGPNGSEETHSSLKGANPVTADTLPPTT